MPRVAFKVCESPRRPTLGRIFEALRATCSRPRRATPCGLTMPDAMWDSYWPPEDEINDIDLELVDLADVPLDLLNHQPPPVPFEKWLTGFEPIYLHHEYNWLSPDGSWNRTYSGIGNGRHRLLHARSLRMASVPASVAELAFWPYGKRPPDRIAIPIEHRCFVHSSFDPANATWHERPALGSAREVDCRQDTD